MEESNQIGEIKDRVDIVEVVEKYVRLKQTGKNFSGLCPFHKEKTPSFIVSPDIQRYKCFGCNRSGDIFNFVQEIENIDFPEALERLAKLAGVELKKTAVNTKFKEIKDINYIATKYYYNALLKDEKAMGYIKGRGFNDESIKKFAIGYAPKFPRLLEKINSSGSFSKKAILDCGLFVEKNGVLRDKFFDRIMFPIRSKRGEVIAFSARQNEGNEYGPKYMNSPETPIFHKSFNLFAQYESRQEIRKQDLAIICEGQTDVIAAHQHGVKNIVAPLGTSLTKDQLQSLANITKNILFFFDSDSAGQAALTRGFVLASELDINPYAAVSTPYKDIDELLQKEPEKFHKLVKEKKEAFSYILSNTIEGLNLNKLEDLNKVKKIILPLLNSVKDPDTKALYARKLKEITGLEYGNVKTVEEESETKIEEPKKVGVKKRNNLETHYLQLLLLAKEKEKYLIDERFFPDGRVKEIYNRIKEIRSPEEKEKLYKESENDEDIKEILDDMIFNTMNLPENDDEMEKDMVFTIKKIKVEYYKAREKALSAKIAMTEELENEEENQKALEELQKISNLRKKIENEQ